MSHNHSARVVRRHRRALFASVASGTLLAVMLTSPASATTATSNSATSPSSSPVGVSVGTDGWITYTQLDSSTLPLTDTSITLVQGVKQPDGSCTFNGGTTATSAINFSEEVALDPTTCSSRVLSGVLPASAPAAVASLTSSPSALVGATARAVPANGLAQATGMSAAAVSYQSAYTMTRWIDPLNIVITSQAINLTWPLYGSGGTLTSSWPVYHFPYDGWSQYGPNFSGFKTLANNAGWYVSANSHFVNTDFATFIYVTMGLSGWLACGAPTTNRADFYHNVTVAGYRNNTATHSYSDNVTGACSNLVHHETISNFGIWS